MSPTTLKTLTDRPVVAASEDRIENVNEVPDDPFPFDYIPESEDTESPLKPDKPVTRPVTEFPMRTTVRAGHGEGRVHFLLSE